jgi:hypothetical protein
MAAASSASQEVSLIPDTVETAAEDAAPSAAQGSQVSNVSLIPETDLAAKLHKEILRRFTKAQWVTITHIYYNLAKYGGLTYGGAVRDYIARISAADLYYAHCKAEGINADANYNKSDVHPESYEGRRKLPNDVDVFITRGNFDKLIKVLDSNFKLKKKHTTNLNYFFKSCDLFKASLTHEKWVINLFNFPYEYVRNILFGRSIKNRHCELSIDFVIINDDYLQHEEYLNKGILYPPFGKPDFNVNLLAFKIDSKYDMIIIPLPYLEKMYYLPNSGMHPLRSYKTHKVIMDSVIANINNKQALPIFPIKNLYTSTVEEDKFVNPYRVCKMLCKRYTIDVYNTMLPHDVLCCWSRDTTEHDTEATCSVCKKVFTNEDRAFNSCSKCPSKMHLMCFRDFLAKLHTPDTAHNCISCAECGEIPFSENYPCELINFLIKLTIQINKPKDKFPCKDCKKWCSECECLIIKCNL